LRPWPEFFVSTRVAFTLFGGDNWLGGLRYLQNLLAAVHALPEKPVESLLFCAPGASAEHLAALAPYLSAPPVAVPGWARSRLDRGKRLLGTLSCGRDAGALRAFTHHEVQVVFQHATWLGWRFPLPTLSWIADLQHRGLPDLFTRRERAWRDLTCALATKYSAAVMVSSQHARRDLESHFPHARGRTRVVPFCVSIPAVDPIAHPSARGGLPERYFYFPGQLWQHKNHLLMLEALRRLKARLPGLVVVATGSAHDHRDPAYPGRLLSMAAREGISDMFLYLGVVPYDDVIAIARSSIALVNPSLFEGWSTTVEEAKAIGLPMLLSDIEVHREQAGDMARYFDPRSADSLACLLELAWGDLAPAVERRDAEKRSMEAYARQRETFARTFSALVDSLA
jgi:glycosyltransferase involved in cell wall biosynthesis